MISLQRSTIVLVIVAALYVFSLRPACWLVQQGTMTVGGTALAYDPILRIGYRYPSASRRALVWWGSPGGQGGAVVRMLDAREIIVTSPPFAPYR